MSFFANSFVHCSPSASMEKLLANEHPDIESILSEPTVVRTFRFNSPTLTKFFVENISRLLEIAFRNDSSISTINAFKILSLGNYTLIPPLLNTARFYNFAVKMLTNKSYNKARNSRTNKDNSQSIDQLKTSEKNDKINSKNDFNQLQENEKPEILEKNEKIITKNNLTRENNEYENKNCKKISPVLIGRLCSITLSILMTGNMNACKHCAFLKILLRRDSNSCVFSILNSFFMSDFDFLIPAQKWVFQEIISGYIIETLNHCTSLFFTNLENFNTNDIISDSKRFDDFINSKSININNLVNNNFNNNMNNFDNNSKNDHKCIDINSINLCDNDHQFRNSNNNIHNDNIVFKADQLKSFDTQDGHVFSSESLITIFTLISVIANNPNIADQIQTNEIFDSLIILNSVSSKLPFTIQNFYWEALNSLYVDKKPLKFCDFAIQARSILIEPTNHIHLYHSLALSFLANFVNLRSDLIDNELIKSVLGLFLQFKNCSLFMVEFKKFLISCCTVDILLCRVVKYVVPVLIVESEIPEHGLVFYFSLSILEEIITNPNAMKILVNVDGASKFINDILKTYIKKKENEYGGEDNSIFNLLLSQKSVY